MNDNDHKHDENCNHAPAPAAEECDLTMSFQIKLRVNMAQGDPRIEQTLNDAAFHAFMDGPLANAMFNAIQQYVTAKCAYMLLSIPPQPDQKVN